MFKTPEQLQAFLLWAKENKIKSVKVGTMQVEFSDLAFVPESMLNDISENGSSKTLAESEPVSKNEEQEDLFWSAQ